MKRTIKRNNRKNKQNGNRKNDQLNPRVNLYSNKDGAQIRMRVVVPIFFNGTTNRYSFQSATDVREFSFANMLQGVSPFTDFLSVYQQVRIRGIDITVNPIRYSEPYTNLYITADPEVANASITNPSANTVINSPKASLFAYIEVMPRTVHYTFPGVGLGGNIWVEAGSTIPGTIYIGNIASTNGNASDIVWEVSFTITAEFRLLKTN